MQQDMKISLKEGGDGESQKGKEEENMGATVGPQKRGFLERTNGGPDIQV